MHKLDYIKSFIALGISCIPLHHRSKEPLLPTWREYQDRAPSPTEYQSWFASEWNNYAVICGWGNLVVLDFDSLFLFALWRDWGRANGLRDVVETSFKVLTNKGVHVYLRTVQRAANDKRMSIKGGIDVQAQGKYVVGPGCVHPSGTQYVGVGALRLVEIKSVEQVLPLDLFPRAANDNAHYVGAPVPLHATTTEYHSDPFTCAGMDLIAKVKAGVRIESLFPGARRTSADGRWLAALCPFHDDHRESFWIDAGRQLCGCQVCGMKPMDVINLVSRMRNLSNADAVRVMANELNVWK